VGASLTRPHSLYVASRGSGHPVLFLHGIPTSCQLWNGVIEGMFGEHTCIAVDLPGLGRTVKTPQGFKDLDRLAASIEQIRIERNVDVWHVVGHDAGCAIAIHYAHQYPQHVGKLALLSPSIFPDLKPFYLFEILRMPLIGELAAPLISLLFWKLAMRLAVGKDHDLKEALLDFHSPFAGLRGAWRLMSLLRWGDPAEVLASIPSLLPQLMMPTLIFHGSQDPAIPQAFATRASELIPNSEVIILKSGHFLPMNEPTAIARELLQFFVPDEPVAAPCLTDAVVAMAG
jgi:haloalkane dehalogenase